MSNSRPSGVTMSSIRPSAHRKLSISRETGSSRDLKDDLGRGDATKTANFLSLAGLHVCTSPGMSQHAPSSQGSFTFEISSFPCVRPDRYPCPRAFPALPCAGTEDPAPPAPAAPPDPETLSLPFALSGLPPYDRGRDESSGRVSRTVWRPARCKSSIASSTAPWSTQGEVIPPSLLLVGELMTLSPSLQSVKRKRARPSC
jgi:hypothetical protein